MIRHTIFATLAASALALPASAQDAYVVGITGGLTGSSASTYAPTVEAVRLYIERVNAAGGINGKQVRLVIQDDSAEPSKVRQLERVVDLCADRQRDQARQRANPVRRRRLSQGSDAAGRPQPVLLDVVRLDHR